MMNTRLPNPDDVGKRCQIICSTIQRTRAALETRYLADDFGE